MSDIRFIIIGVLTITISFIFLGVYGESYTVYTVQMKEFSDCYDFQDDNKPTKLNCDKLLQEKILFFLVVIGIIAAGILALIKGIRGNWDQKVKPEDMVGPGGSDKNESDIE